MDGPPLGGAVPEQESTRMFLCTSRGWHALRLGEGRGRATQYHHSTPIEDSGRATQIASGFTLVEMLVAMAITLVMMAAVVTLFANVSESVRNRRATIEMSNQLRHVRHVLQQ